MGQPSEECAKIINNNMIYASLGGRLGNQMFQYVIARIIGEKSGYGFYIPRIGEAPLPSPEDPTHHINTFFTNIDMGHMDGTISNIFQEPREQEYNPNIFNIPNNTRIYGYYQTDKYYTGYEDKIKEWFKFDMDESTRKILEIYPIDEYCYLHFRAHVFGEVGTHPYGDSHVSHKYYQSAIDRVKQEMPDIKILIVTDDIEVCKKVFGEEHNITSNEMMVDFKLLYYSKYCIASPSSFSWWAAWLSDKIITVAPDNWIFHDHPHMGCFPVDVKTNKFIYV